MTVRPARHTLVFAAFALAAALALGACGDPDRASSASLTSDEKDATELVAGPASAIRKAGVASAEQPTMQLQMEVTIDDQVVSSSTMRSTADGSAGWGTINMPGLGDVPTLVTGGAYYYGFPNLPPGKQWVRVGFDELSDAVGVDPGAATQQDPTQAFAMLDAVSDEVETVGDEDVAGVATTHYRFTLNIDDMLDAQIARGVLTEDAAATISQFNDRTDMDVWIGADGLVRRMTYSLDLATGVGSSAVSSVGYSFEFSDYGGPVDVIAPAPEATMSMAEMMTHHD